MSKRAGLLSGIAATVLALVLLIASIASYAWFAREIGIGQPDLLSQVLDHINGWIGWAALALIGVPLTPVAARGISAGYGMYRDWRSTRHEQPSEGMD